MYKYELLFYTIPDYLILQVVSLIIFQYYLRFTWRPQFYTEWLVHTTLDTETNKNGFHRIVWRVPILTETNPQHHFIAICVESILSDSN